MKVGEIWKYKQGFQELWNIDQDAYEEGDEFVTIVDIVPSDMDNEIWIEITHNVSTISGIYRRKRFLSEYEKVYKEQE